MKKTYKYRLLPLVLAAVLLALCLLAGCAARDGDTAVSTDGADAGITEYSDLSGKTVSMLTGAPFENLVSSKAPDVGSFTFYNNMPDMVLALESGKTDAILMNNAVSQLAVNRNDKLTLFPHNLSESAFGIAFQKGDPTRDVWQAAYDTISDEVIQAAWEKWTGSDDSVKTLPEQDWPGLNGTVQAAVCDTNEPLSYAGKGGELIGFDIEMILLMAKELDVHVEFTGMEFSAILATVQSGKATLGAGSMIVTDERREAVDFVEYYPAAIVLIVRAPQTEPETSKTVADMEHAKIGVTTGTLFAEIVHAALPDAELLYFNTLADMVNALKSGKVDAFSVDEPVSRTLKTEDSTLTRIPELLDSANYAYALSKNQRGAAIKAELDEYMISLWDDGTMDALQTKWFDGADLSSTESTDYRDLPATNGTIRLVTNQYPPFIQSLDGFYTGYEIEIIAMFCRDRGYALEITETTFDGLLASIQSGKADIGCSSITITAERSEVMLFSEPDYSGGTALVVMKDATPEENGSFLSSVADSFEKTFIRENRWKLFLEGIGTTLLITALSIIFGTALGFGAFMLCRNGNRLANRITDFFVWLVRGLPVVVLLMILYYIIFGNVSISGTAVSVIGFTLVFGAGVFGIIKSGVSAIDRGQLEAAYALGYTNRRAFFRIILPQAMPHFMPAYKGSITELIKATAIVGYVAVQDLTKMGDIVRSRTYEAFFPLIAVAIIYFILAAILTFIVNRIELKIDPKLRKPEDIRKEVEAQ